MEVFPEQLNSNISRDSISLKYCRRAANGAASWAGLRAARGSADIWQLLLMSGSDIVEVGVCWQSDGDGDDPALDPIIGRGGQQICAFFYKSNELRWASQEPMMSIPVPRTYKVRLLGLRNAIFFYLTTPFVGLLTICFPTGPVASPSKPPSGTRTWNPGSGPNEIHPITTTWI